MRARYELLALKWRWLTRNMAKSPITLGDAKDHAFFLPGMVVHDGTHAHLVARVDHRKGVLWVVKR